MKVERSILNVVKKEVQQNERKHSVKKNITGIVPIAYIQNHQSNLNVLGSWTHILK